jgi:hypothetical protein
MFKRKNIPKKRVSDNRKYGFFDVCVGTHGFRAGLGKGIFRGFLELFGVFRLCPGAYYLNS